MTGGHAACDLLLRKAWSLPAAVSPVSREDLADKRRCARVSLRVCVNIERLCVCLPSSLPFWWEHNAQGGLEWRAARICFEHRTCKCVIFVCMATSRGGDGIYVDRKDALAFDPSLLGSEYQVKWNCYNGSVESLAAYTSLEVPVPFGWFWTVCHEV